MKIVTAIICGIFFCCFCSCDKADPVSYNIDDGLYATLKNDFKDWESKNDDEKIAKLSEAYTQSRML